MNINIDNLIHSIIIIIVGIIIYEIIKYFMNKGKLYKKNTYFSVFRSVLKIVYVLFIILIVLQVNGIDVSSMLAGVGVASVIVGLALQDFLKDIFRGISLISENYFKVGDIIKFETYVGKVIELGIKTTKIKDIYTDNIVSIANRNIEKVEVISKTIYLDVPLPYELKLEKAEKVLNEIVDEVKKIDKVIETEYKGVQNLSESSIDYKIMVSCDPANKIAIRRQTIRTILQVLEQNKIQVPYKQIDIHTK